MSPRCLTQPLRPWLLTLPLLSVLWATGCAPEIGDACSTALDCSAQATRICDRTQPGGYCTIAGCEMGSCPDEAVCVKFRPEEPRLAQTYCMYRCQGDSDCREGRGYACLRGEDFGDGSDAVVLDGDNKRFCGLVETPDRSIEQDWDPDIDAGAADAGQ